jgi:hypothetical protein
MMAAIIWVGVAVLMYAILRKIGYVGGPFDLLGEFISAVIALIKAIGAMIGGAGFSAFLLLVPPAPGPDSPVIQLFGGLLRLIELVAWVAAAATAAHAIRVYRAGDLPYGRPR